MHTAPGHGEEDYLVGMKFGLPMPMPVDDNGVFDAGGGPFAGLSVDEANPVIIEWLREHGSLLAAGEDQPQLPALLALQAAGHLPRDRAVVRLDGRARTCARPRCARSTRSSGFPAGRSTAWPAMVGDRPDWCISRQRAWGVPIPVFECAKCGETVATPETFAAVEQLFATEGADAWFTKAPSEYLPAGTACPRCGGTELAPETDIVDVWFESGVSHTSVLETRAELTRPATMYLEGSDQHRGWFQSSLLTSVGAYDAAPFEKVLTHGFIVDGDGRKMSKSLGNVISPLDVIAKSGADIIRLWVASADYGQDVSVSDEILDRTSEAYRRIRNTFRFLLSNLYDFDPATDRSRATTCPSSTASRWSQLADLLEPRHDRPTTSGASTWSTARIYDYVGELSRVYLDVLKDRLYADAPDERFAPQRADGARRDPRRARARARAGALVHLRGGLALHARGDARCRERAAHRLADASTCPPRRPPSCATAYAVVLEVREVVTKALEEARNAKVIGKSQEAAVALTRSGRRDGGAARRAATARSPSCSSSRAVDVVAGRRSSRSSVAAAEGEKCPRCWNIRELGADAAHPEVCARCAEVLGSLG